MTSATRVSRTARTQFNIVKKQKESRGYTHKTIRKTVAGASQDLMNSSVSEH
jgi:hypothetical protein